MKLLFYPRLAWTGIRKNRRLYLPYLFTCVGMVMMEYITRFLQDSEAVRAMRGAETITSMLSFGSFVVAIFALIFLFYTNSFLMRRRKKEFGLYSILGMSRRNLGRILLWETLFALGISLALGLFAGAALSKLAELILLYILRGSTTYSLTLSAPAAAFTLCVFLVIFALLFLKSLWQVRSLDALSLLKSESVGEKPPRANWALGLLGLLVLGAGYALAVYVGDPMSALEWFFVAVILVIIGTYMVFVSFSVVLLRFLQKRKGYYYQARHFVSVSSMAYRMKRNGAGLASICILATMVLVMISTTVSLYCGVEDSLNTQYPYDLNVTAYPSGAEDFTDEGTQRLINALTDALTAEGLKPETVLCFREASLTGILKEGGLLTRQTSGAASLNRWQRLYFLDVNDYNRLSGEAAALAPDEALVCILPRGAYEWDTLAVEDELEFRVVGRPELQALSRQAASDASPSIYAVVSDLNAVTERLSAMLDDLEGETAQARWRMGIDLVDGRDTYVSDDRLARWLVEDGSFTGEGSFVQWVSCASRSVKAADFYNLYGSLLFLGGILSVVFVCAAVLIIYYKQISEGYEDQARFEIMQKVGMTKREIRRSINSQLLTVFFLPLLGALCHLCFAFPMLLKLLQLFNLNNVPLFAAATLLSFLVFALMYALVYKLTSGAYCAIVSGAKKE